MRASQWRGSEVMIMIWGAHTEPKRRRTDSLCEKQRERENCEGEEGLRKNIFHSSREIKRGDMKQNYLDCFSLLLYACAEFSLSLLPNDEIFYVQKKKLSLFARS